MEKFERLEEESRIETEGVRGIVKSLERGRTAGHNVIYRNGDVPKKRWP